MKKDIIFIIVTILTIVIISSSIQAADWTPQGNINNKNTYNITNVPYYNGTNINVTGWILSYGTNLSALNVTGLIKDWNISGYLQNWNASGYIKNWNITGYITNWNSSGYIRDWSGGTGDNESWNQSYASSELYFTKAQWNVTNTSYHLTGNELSDIINWTNIQNYPVSCPAGTFVTQINDSITCTAITESDPLWTGNISNYFTKSQWNATNSSYLLIDQFNTTNSTYNAYNSTGLIINWSNVIAGSDLNDTGLVRDWNVSGWIRNQTTAETNWNASGWIRNQTIAETNWNSTGYLINWSNIDDWNLTGLIQDWNASGFIRDWALAETDSLAYNGTLAYNQTLTDIWSDILNGADLNATGLIKDWNVSGWIRNQTTAETNWNSSSYIVNWSLIIEGASESDPLWTANITNYFTKAQWNVTNSSYLMIDRFNVTNSSYVADYGDTMTGNLNLSASNLTINWDNRICLIQNCTSYLYYNGTHGIWK